MKGVSVLARKTGDPCKKPVVWHDGTHVRQQPVVFCCSVARWLHVNYVRTVAVCSVASWPCLSVHFELAYPVGVCVCETGIVDSGGGRGGSCVDGGLIPRKPVAAAPAPGQSLLAPGVVTGGVGGGLAGMGDVLLPPKKQAVVDRLRRRLESYRRRQSDCIPRFDQSFNGICEQNIQETLVLKQRFLESKAKRAAKKTDKKQESSNTLHTVRTCAVRSGHFLPWLRTHTWRQPLHNGDRKQLANVYHCCQSVYWSAGLCCSRKIKILVTPAEMHTYFSLYGKLVAWVCV